MVQVLVGQAIALRGFKLAGDENPLLATVRANPHLNLAQTARAATAIRPLLRPTVDARVHPATIEPHPDVRTRCSMVRWRALVAAIAVKGMLRGKTVIVPGWHNWLYTTLASCLPAWVLGRFTLWFNKKRGIAGTAH